MKSKNEIPKENEKSLKLKFCATAELLSGYFQQKHVQFSEQNQAC